MNRRLMLVVLGVLCLNLVGCKESKEDASITKWGTTASESVEMSTNINPSKEVLEESGSEFVEETTKEETSKSSMDSSLGIETELESENEESSMKQELEVSMETNEENIEEENWVTINTGVVKGVLENVLKVQTSSEATAYFYEQHIKVVDGFQYKPIVNQDTRVAVEYIGVNSENPNKYKAIVTLRQSQGISKFAFTVWVKDNAIEMIEYERF